MRYEFTPSDIERFWSKVDKREPNECWFWLGNHGATGYGQFRYTYERGHYTTINAHRVAWILTHGPIEQNICVCHNCPTGDDRRCVNPAHMFLGTKADNATDRHIKGRDNFARGSQLPQSRIRAEDIPVIRQLIADGMTQKAVGQRYGVCQATIWRLLNKVCWAHVE